MVRCGFILTEEALFPLSCRLSTSTLPSLPPSHHPDTRKRIEELDYFRGIAILFVVFGHSWQSPHGQIYDLSQAIMVGGTTLFVFISGFFFAKTYASRDGSYREFLGKKILNVGMPFVAVTLVFLGIIFLKLPFTTDTGGGGFAQDQRFSYVRLYLYQPLVYPVCDADVFTRSLASAFLPDERGGGC